MNTATFNRKHRMIKEKLNDSNPIANKDWLEEIFGRLK
jgi:hypothetical protein